MLDDKRLYELTENVIDIARQIEIELLLSIARRIDVNDAIGGTTEWQLKQLNQMGLLHEESIRIISQYSGKTVREVKELIEKAAIESIDMSTLMDVYDRGLAPINPLSINLQPVISNYQEALERESRLILTRAITSSNRQYQAMIDKVALEVNGGLKSYTQAMQDALNELSDKGITSTQYKGIDKNGDPYVIDYSIEASIRRSTMTSINQVANSSNELIIDELKPPQIAVSQHMGARNKGVGHENHESWQGNAYNNDGTFERITGYGNSDMLGLGGYNCRHLHFAYYEGISPPLDELVSYSDNSKKYELEQKQRRYERLVRDAKKRLEVAKLSGDKEWINKAKKLRDKRISRLDNFVKENGLRRDYSRERISNSNSGNIPKKSYSDVTEEWYKSIDRTKVTNISDSYQYTKDSVEYNKSNSYIEVGHDYNEELVANILKDTFNENIEYVPRVAPSDLGGKFIRTPDYLFKEEYWDLKTINGASRYSISNRVKGGKGQANNFVINIAKEATQPNELIMSQLNYIYRNKNFDFVKKIIVVKDSKVVLVTQKRE